jgi:hypothetical protein
MDGDGRPDLATVTYADDGNDQVVWWRNLPPPADDGPSDMPSDDEIVAATCEEYVAHYNGLPCATNSLEVSNTCSESISEFCTGEEAFNACRIENTFCTDEGQFAQTVDECSTFLDCSG